MTRRLTVKKILFTFAIVWAATTISVDAFVIWRTAKQYQAGRWPTAAGTILEAAIESDRTSPNEDPHWELKVRYRYAVDGRTYRSNRWRFGAMAISRRSGATIGYKESDFPDFKPGSTQTVWYNGDDPSESVLVAGVTNSDRKLILFVIPFNVFLCLLPALVYRQYRPADERSLRIVETASVQKVRLTEWTPVAAVLLGLIVGSLAVSVLTWVFMSPSRLVGLLLPGPLLALALSALTWLLQRTGAGSLVIDRRQNTVRIPRRGPRRSVARVPIGDVIGVEMGRRQVLDRTLYRPVLVVVSTSGNDEPRRMLLAEWYSRPKATALVDWLRQRFSLTRETTGS